MSEHQAGIFDRSFTEHLFLEFALGGGHSVEAVRGALREASLALACHHVLRYKNNASTA